MAGPGILIGEQAPDFQLVGNTGQTWRLSENRGKVIALLFYPGDETLVCTRQLCSLRDYWRDYLATKAEVVGISPGTSDQHSAFAQAYRLPIPLLADEDSAVTNMYCAHWILPTNFMRSIVIIDAKGFVRTRRTMPRVFRPTDRSVLTAIYAARGDALEDRYSELLKRDKNDLTI